MTELSKAPKLSPFAIAVIAAIVIIIVLYILNSGTLAGLLTRG